MERWGPWSGPVRWMAVSAPGPPLSPAARERSPLQNNRRRCGGGSPALVGAIQAEIPAMAQISGTVLLVNRDTTIAASNSGIKLSISAAKPRPEGLDVAAEIQLLRLADHNHP